MIKSSNWFGTWATKSVLAVIDQAITTGINFVFGVLLARWLSPENYGAYAVAYACFLLLSTAYQSLLLEPMSVLGPSVHSGHPRRYLGDLLVLHGIISISVVITLGLAAWIAFAIGEIHTLPSGLLGIAVAAPCILLLWLTRNTYYTKLAPWRATLGSIGYAVLLTSLVVVTLGAHRMTPFSAFLIMGLSALVVGVIQLFRLRPQIAPGNTALRGVITSHWQFGRWLLAGSVLVWITSNIYFIVFSANGNLARAGELKALLNFTLPIGQTATALSLLLQPFAARAHYSQGTHSVIGIANRIILVYVAASSVYWLVVLLLRRTLFEFLYGSRYTNVMELLPIVAISSILAVAAHGPGIGLRAVRSTSSVFMAFTIPSVLSIVIGIPATLMFGLRGTLLVLIFANAIALVISYILLRRRSHSLNEQPSAIADCNVRTCVAHSD